MTCLTRSELNRLDGITKKYVDCVALVITQSTSGTSMDYRFITTSTTLLPGREKVYFDLFLLDTYIISAGDTSYSIAGNSFTNNALLSILDEVWVDTLLEIDGEITIGV